MKIAFVGDIALVGKYDITKNPNAKIRLNNLSKKLKEYDYVVGNLESPLTNRDHTLVCKSMHLRSAPKNVELLKDLNINAVSLANNHIFDFGKKGMNESIKILEDNGIEWFGVDKKYLLKEIKGEKVSFSGFCCYSTNGAGYRKKKGIRGVNPLTSESIIDQIHSDEKNNAYSLGNYLFDDTVSITGRWILKQIPENKKSFILEVEIIDGALINVEYVGFIDDDIEGLKFYDIKDEIKLISEPLEKDLFGKEYEKMRNNQISKSLESKFGKRDWKWLISRLNYYSICARIKGKFMKKKYLKEVKKFL